MSKDPKLETYEERKRRLDALVKALLESLRPEPVKETKKEGEK